MEEGESMEAMTYDPCTEPPHGVMVLTQDSVEYVGGDIGDDGIMDVGETWEWRVVTVGIAGDFVLLSPDAHKHELCSHWARDGHPGRRRNIPRRRGRARPD